MDDASVMAEDFARAVVGVAAGSAALAAVQIGHAAMIGSNLTTHSGWVTSRTALAVMAVIMLLALVATVIALAVYDARTRRPDDEERTRPRVITSLTFSLLAAVFMAFGAALTLNRSGGHTPAEKIVIQMFALAALAVVVGITADAFGRIDAGTCGSTHTHSGAHTHDGSTHTHSVTHAHSSIAAAAAKAEAALASAAAAARAKIVAAVDRDTFP